MDRRTRAHWIALAVEQPKRHVDVALVIVTRVEEDGAPLSRPANAYAAIAVAASRGDGFAEYAIIAVAVTVQVAEVLLRGGKLVCAPVQRHAPRRVPCVRRAFGWPAAL